MIATFADHVDVVKLLTESGNNRAATAAAVRRRPKVVDAVDRNGRNVLFYAVSEGRLDTLLYLLDAGVRASPDRRRVNVLMEAAGHGHVELVRRIVAIRRSLDIRLDDDDESGWNALFYALNSPVESGVLALLIDAGVPIRRSADGRTLLMVAAIRNYAGVVEYLAENADRFGIDLPERDPLGRNALFYAVTGGDRAVVDALWAAGVPAEPSYAGVTVLMQAAAKQRRALLRHLCERATEFGVDVGALDANGWNVAMYATASGQLDLLETVTGYGAECRPSAVDGRTPLMQAAVDGDAAFLEYFLANYKEFGMGVDQLDFEGKNALHYTVQGKCVSVDDERRSMRLSRAHSSPSCYIA